MIKWDRRRSFLTIYFIHSYVSLSWTSLPQILLQTISDHVLEASCSYDYHPPSGGRGGRFGNPLPQANNGFVILLPLNMNPVCDGIWIDAFIWTIADSLLQVPYRFSVFCPYWAGYLSTQRWQLRYTRWPVTEAVQGRPISIPCFCQLSTRRQNTRRLAEFVNLGQWGYTILSCDIVFSWIV